MMFQFCTAQRTAKTLTVGQINPEFENFRTGIRGSRPPVNPETHKITIQCPWCGAATQSDLRSVKAHDEAGRLDQCYSCQKDFILEAEAGEVAVSRGLTLE